MDGIRFIYNDENKIKLDKCERKSITKHAKNYVFNCPTCGTKVDIYPCGAEKWAYRKLASSRLKYDIFCSYSCLREFEKHQVKNTWKKRIITIDRDNNVMKFDSINQATIELSVSRSSIMKSIKKECRVGDYIYKYAE